MIVHGARIRHRVLLQGLRLSVRIGIRDGEAEIPQPIVVDARLDMRRGPPSGPGALSASWAAEAEYRETVCYDTLATRIRGVAESRAWALVEDLAEALVALCLADCRVVRVILRVRKPQAIPDADAAGVEIEAVREDSVEE